MRRADGPIAVRPTGAPTEKNATLLVRSSCEQLQRIVEGAVVSRLTCPPSGRSVKSAVAAAPTSRRRGRGTRTNRRGTNRRRLGEVTPAIVSAPSARCASGGAAARPFRSRRDRASALGGASDCRRADAGVHHARRGGRAFAAERERRQRARPAGRTLTMVLRAGEKALQVRANEDRDREEAVRSVNWPASIGDGEGCGAAERRDDHAVERLARLVEHRAVDMAGAAPTAMVSTRSNAAPTREPAPRQGSSADAVSRASTPDAKRRLGVPIASKLTEPASRGARGDGPPSLIYAYDALTRKFHVRVSVLFAVLSVTLISSR